MESYEVECKEVGGILVDVYSDILYASFVYKGRRFAQSYRHGTSGYKIAEDAILAINRK